MHILCSTADAPTRDLLNSQHLTNDELCALVDYCNYCYKTGSREGGPAGGSHGPADGDLRGPKVGMAAMAACTSVAGGARGYWMPYCHVMLHWTCVHTCCGKSPGCLGTQYGAANNVPR